MKDKRRLLGFSMGLDSHSAKRGETKPWSLAIRLSKVPILQGDWGQPIVTWGSPAYCQVWDNAAEYRPGPCCFISLQYAAAAGIEAVFSGHKAWEGHSQRPQWGWVDSMMRFRGGTGWWLGGSVNSLLAFISSTFHPPVSLFSVFALQLLSQTFLVTIKSRGRIGI